MIASDLRAEPALLGRFRDLLERLDRAPFWPFQLLFRIAIGAVFWDAGLSKIASWQSTIALFRQEYRVPVLPPELAATLATTIELTCPVLLVLGLATRLATLPMLAQAAVIQFFVYPEDWIEHLGWAAFLLALLFRGPGLVSLDHWLRRRYLAARPG